MLKVKLKDVKTVTIITCLLFTFSLFSQNKSGEVLLINETETLLTVRSIGYHSNKKQSLEQAQINALSTLIKKGIADFNNGAPLVGMDTNQDYQVYFSRFFSQNRYQVFIKECTPLGKPERVKGKGFQSLAQVSIYIRALKRDLQANNIPLFSKNLVEEKSQKNLSSFPSIMVVPYRLGKNTYKNILEKDFDKRIAVGKVQEGFNKKGVSTVDLEAKINASHRSSQFEMADALTIDKQLIRNSGAEVYVTVDIEKDFSDLGNRVALIMKAYETASGKTLANQQGWSARFNTSAMDQLCVLVIEDILDDFLNQILANLTEKKAINNSIVLNIGLANEATIDLETEFGAHQLPLSDILRLWVKEHAQDGLYHVQGTVAEAMIFDQVYIPTTDKNGNSLTVNDFAFDFWNYLRNDIGVSCKKRVDGKTIYLTIEE